MTGTQLDGARIAPDHEAMIMVPGGRIYARVNGDLSAPCPPLIMIHGGPGSSHWHFLNATVIADERAVILYDQLDSGRSERPGDPANWHVARFLAEIEAIRCHFGIARWHVLGASWGGALALEYGATRPKALASLALQSGLVETSAWVAVAGGLRERLPAGEEGDAAFRRRHIQRREPPAEIAAYRDGLPIAFNPAIYRHMWGESEYAANGTLGDYDATPRLAQIDGARTLFVTGAHDEATPASIGAYAARIPGARFAVIADAAHLIMNDAPADYAELLRGWLDEHDA